jgi:hypothetical protein
VTSAASGTDEALTPVTQPLLSAWRTGAPRLRASRRLRRLSAAWRAWLWRRACRPPVSRPPALRHWMRCQRCCWATSKRRGTWRMRRQSRLGARRRPCLTRWWRWRLLGRMHLGCFVTWSAATPVLPTSCRLRSRCRATRCASGRARRPACSRRARRRRRTCRAGRLRCLTRTPTRPRRRTRPRRPTTAACACSWRSRRWAQRARWLA